MNKVWVRQETQHFYPRTSDEVKNPWHWQLWEPTYRLALLFHHNWDGWWIGSCFDRVKGKSSRVWSPWNIQSLGSLLLSHPVSLCLVHLCLKAAKSLPILFLMGIKEEERGKKGSDMPMIPGGSMGLTAGIFPPQIRMCFWASALPTVPQDLPDNVLETHRRRFSFVLAFVLSPFLLSPPSSQPTLQFCVVAVSLLGILPI